MRRGPPLYMHKTTGKVFACPVCEDGDRIKDLEAKLEKARVALEHYAEWLFDVEEGRIAKEALREIE